MLSVYDYKGKNHDIIENSDFESTNKYLKLHDGTMIIYLRGAVYTGNSVRISFPLNFTNDENEIVVNVCGDCYSNIEINGIDKKGIYVKATTKNSSTTCNFFMIAIGRWK